METNAKKQRQQFYRDYASGQWSMSELACETSQCIQAVQHRHEQCDGMAFRNPRDGSHLRTEDVITLQKEAHAPHSQARIPAQREVGVVGTLVGAEIGEADMKLAAYDCCGYPLEDGETLLFTGPGGSIHVEEFGPEQTHAARTEV